MENRYNMGNMENNNGARRKIGEQSINTGEQNIGVPNGMRRSGMPMGGRVPQSQSPGIVRNNIQQNNGMQNVGMQDQIRRQQMNTGQQGVNRQHYNNNFHEDQNNQNPYNRGNWNEEKGMVDPYNDIFHEDQNMQNPYNGYDQTVSQGQMRIQGQGRSSYNRSDEYQNNQMNDGYQNRPQYREDPWGFDRETGGSNKLNEDLQRQQEAEEELQNKRKRRNRIIRNSVIAAAIVLVGSFIGFRLYQNKFNSVESKVDSYVESIVDGDVNEYTKLFLINDVSVSELDNISSRMNNIHNKVVSHFGEDFKWSADIINKNVSDFTDTAETVVNVKVNGLGDYFEHGINVHLEKVDGKWYIDENMKEAYGYIFNDTYVMENVEAPSPVVEDQTQVSTEEVVVPETQEQVGNEEQQQGIIDQAQDKINEIKDNVEVTVGDAVNNAVDAGRDELEAQLRELGVDVDLSSYSIDELQRLLKTVKGE